MNTEKKIWGETCKIFTRNNVSIHRIKIDNGGSCSKHYHEYKHNIFYIECGKIKIQNWKNSSDIIDEVVLSSGEMFSVPPKVYHKFIAMEDSIVYEIYYIELIDNDIVRENV